MRQIIILFIISFLAFGCKEPDHPLPPNPAPGPAPDDPFPPPVPPVPDPDPTPDPGPTPDPSPFPDADQKSGRIGKIIDGDTCTVSISGVVFPVTVHLYGIDSPEANQEYGERSKAYFEDLIEQNGEDVTLFTVEDKSRWSKVAWLRLSNGLFYNYEVVRYGWAWERDSGVDELVRLADGARRNGYGIWESEVNEEPWVWRQSQGITEEDDKHAHAEPTGEEDGPN